MGDGGTPPRDHPVTVVLNGRWSLKKGKIMYFVKTMTQ